MYIGGKPCNLTNDVDGKTITCVVPLLDNYVPGLYYDLTINDTVYGDDPEIGILPAAISFIPGPILSSVIPCIDTLTTDNSNYPKCQPGQPLTVIGTDFLPADPSAYLTIQGGGFAGNCSGSNLVVVDNEHLVCTSLPDLGSASRWQQTALTLYSNGNASSTLQLWLYETARPYNVTYMTGCASGVSSMVNSMPTLTGCFPGEYIDIMGDNINAYPSNRPVHPQLQLRHGPISGLPVGLSALCLAGSP